MFGKSRHLKPGRLFAAAILSVTFLAARPGSADSPVVMNEVPLPSGAGSAEPHLAAGAGGEIVLSWLEPRGDGTALRYSVLGDAAWKPPVTVAEGADWFVNWADFPSVTPVDERVWAAHWLVKRPGGTYAYDVAIALSHDGGRSWSEAITPHTDNTRTEHGFVSLFPWQEGIGALWLDGRNMPGDGGHAEHASGDRVSGMTLRSAVVTADRRLVHGQMVDELVCDCCQTDVGVGPDGPIAVYRNRTEGEIRDIYVARAIDGYWRAGRAVAHDGWKIAGCPVNGPAIAVHGSDVAVAWFTGAEDLPRIRLARSNDAGNSFSAPVEIDGKGALGRVDVEWLDDGESVVTWLRKGGNGEGTLGLRVIAADGTLGPVAAIARTSAARPSGFPQLARKGKQLVVAWTADVSGEASTVRTVLIDAASLPRHAVSP